jgi:hypothetical protein
MRSVISKLNRRLRPIFESSAEPVEHIWWKSPDSPDYNRQLAEDALYHTIGPLTNNPRWASEWTSKSEPVPGFVGGGPAPRWDEHEITMAMAGDQSYQRGPMSPKGSPIYRLAMKTARKFGRENDQDLIADFYANGLLRLATLMKPGYDQSRSTFIQYALPYIRSAMDTGTGKTLATQAAAGFRSEGGIVGFKGLLDYNITQGDPERIRKIATQIKGKYREQRSHDKDKGNPLGPYSKAFWELANAYADALESDNEDRIEAIRHQIGQKIEEIESESTVLGARLGIGQAMTDPTRKTPMKIVSVDAPMGDDEGSSTIAGSLESKKEDEAEWITPQVINKVLMMALDEEWMKYTAIKMKSDKKLAAFAVEKLGLTEVINEPLTANEFRFVIRTLGTIASEYPGKGVVRKNINMPRNSKGWWKPGEDPEIEPFSYVKKGTNERIQKMWKSRWATGRKDPGQDPNEPYKKMNNTEIMREMFAENDEFRRLAIRTATPVKKDQIAEKYAEYFGRLLDTRNPEELAKIRSEYMAVYPENDRYYHYINTNIPRYIAALKKRDNKTIERYNKEFRTKFDMNSGEVTRVTGFSPVTIGEQLNRALNKLKIIVFSERRDLEDPQVIKPSKLKASEPEGPALAEELHRSHPIDRELIIEACEWMCSKIESVLNEKSPPGWKKTVEHMKEKGMTEKEAFSRAWATHKKGGSRPDRRKKNKYYVESSMKPIDSISDDIYEIE